jgi:predicted ATPase
MGRTVSLVRGPRREEDTFYLRGESFFNVATRVEELGGGDSGFLRYYGGRSPHEQSHGESFLGLAANRFAGEGLYLLDEPEAALSPGRQLAFLKLMDNLVRLHGSQIVVATHSPILMAYPDALIYEFGEHGIRATTYEETEHFSLTRDFLLNPSVYLRELFRDS